MPASYWLLKTEPSTYNFSQLLKDRKTNWNGVRNYQARNFLRELKKDDLALIYHSGDEKAVVGLAKVIKEAYPDLELKDGEKKGDWVQVDLAPVKTASSPVALAQLKAHPQLKELKLVKHSRLSVSPVTAEQFKILAELAGVLK